MNTSVITADQIIPPSATTAHSLADVGVVIPVYNRRSILLETLQYVVAQTVAPRRVVIVDDGSSDGSADAAQAWLAERRPPAEWRVVRARHSTAAAARNAGLALVQDLPFVAFLDSDDHWPADFLARCVTLLDGAGEAVAVSVDRHFASSTGETTRYDDMASVVADPVAWFFANGAGVASCTVFRTHAVLASDSWPTDADSAEDSILFCRIAELGPWLHAPGDPVRFDQGSARERSEEHNLSERYSDRQLRWSRVHERIYRELAQSQAPEALARLHGALAYRWTNAAKQLLALGRADEARYAIDRALYWRPTSISAWRRKATLTLSTALPLGRASRAA